jgi:uncharacterized membrane protein
MIRNENTVVIRRPIEEVFACVSDLQNSPKWQKGLVEALPISTGPLGVGAQYTGVRKFMGRRVESVIQFTTYEPNKKIVFKSISGSMPMETSFRFESTVEGTRLTTIIELQPAGFMSLAEPLIASGLRREMDANFGDLKDLLESRVPAVAS